MLRSDHYITLVRWRDSLHLLVTWSNRLQNKTFVTICHAVSTDCHLVSSCSITTYITTTRFICIISVCLSV